MRRWLIVLIYRLSRRTLIAVPRASAGDAPIGHIGDTLRVDTGTDDRGRHRQQRATVSTRRRDSATPAAASRSRAFPSSAVDARRRDGPRGPGAEPVSSWPPTSASTASPRSPTPTSPGPPMLPTRWTPCRQCASRLDRARRGVLGRLPRSGLQCRSAGQEDGPCTSRNGTCDARRRIATADSVDALSWPPLPHALFRWPVHPSIAPQTSRRSSTPTCPPRASPSIWPTRSGAILTARPRWPNCRLRHADRGVGDDPEVQRAVHIRPAAELSKMYVLPDYHGAGVATALMDAALTAAAEWGARCVWLGVNQKNQRAQRFYTQERFHGSTAPGRFRLGAHPKTTTSWSGRWT